MRENNRFRFTGGAAVRPYSPEYPIQGTEGLSNLEMQAQGAGAAARNRLYGDPMFSRYNPELAQEAADEYMRMQLGQAQNQPDAAELEARELTAAKGLTGMPDDTYKRALIELLFGGHPTSGLRK